MNYLNCCRCKESKSETRFDKNPLRKRGFNYDCKDCRAKARAQSRRLNPEETKAKDRLQYARNIEASRDRQRRHRMRHKERIAARRKELYYLNHAEARRKHRIYVQSRPAQRRAYEKLRRKRDVNWHILSKIRGRIRGAIYATGHKKLYRTERLLGCSVQEFKAHLEKQFKPGMSWANRSSWHIDHKIPCARFDFTDPHQQLACFHFSNLQPLWPSENHSKRDRIIA